MEPGLSQVRNCKSQIKVPIFNAGGARRPIATAEVADSS